MSFAFVAEHISEFRLHSRMTTNHMLLGAMMQMNRAYER